MTKVRGQSARPFPTSPYSKMSLLSHENLYLLGVLSGIGKTYLLERKMQNKHQCCWIESSDKNTDREVFKGKILLSQSLSN
eukprot:scaffold605168_cov18-Prasinocladus_malaysianus.AAC.1